MKLDAVILIRSVMTVVAFATFIGIVIWAWSKKRRDRFEAAAQSIFEDDGPVDPARGAGD